MVNSLNRNLGRNMIRMDEFQRQLSTTRRINKPSDDPAGLVKALRLRTNLVEGEQYLANINESMGFMDTTDSAFGNINEILHTAREKTIAAATNAKTTSDFEAIAKEIRELNEQLKLIANSTYGSKYIFGGTNVTEEPYLPSGWQGNQEAIMAEIGIGVVIPVNIDAKQFFAGRTDDLSVKAASGINPDKVTIKNLQEGNYKLNTSNGVASEIANNLNAVKNTGNFFFYNDPAAGTAKAASITGSVTTGTMGSPYSGTLTMEVTAVNDAADTLTVNIKGRLAIGNGEYKDISITGKSLNMAAANDANILTLSTAELAAGGLAGATQDLNIWNRSGQALAGISAPPDSEFTVGDSVKIGLTAVPDTAQEIKKELGSQFNNGKFFFYDNAGTPAAASLAGGSAAGATDSSYHGYFNMEVAAGGVNAAADQLTVNITGQVAIGNGTYQNISVNGIVLQMNAGAGAAICTIPAASLAAGGLTGATQPLVLWNNSGSALAGINDASPEFADGDKVGIQFSLPMVQSTACESQSYLTAVPNAGSFFYENMGQEATLGVGTGSGSLLMPDGQPRPLANDSAYSGSLLIETTKVEPGNGKIGPRVIKVDTNAAAPAETTLSLNRPLYMKDYVPSNGIEDGTLVAIKDGTDLKDYFNITRGVNQNPVTGQIQSAIYDADTKQITFTFVNNGADLQAGDTITWNNDWDANASPAAQTVPECGKGRLFDQYGNEFQRIDSAGNQNQPIKLTCNAPGSLAPGSPPQWAVYDDKYESGKITVDIKGHLYTGDGKYKYVELENIVIDSEKARNEQIFKISAADIKDPNFTEDLVIWNNGNDTLGGIDPNTPQIKVGDKTVISFAKQSDASSQNTQVNFNYKTADGKVVEGVQDLKFDNGTFDYHTRELKFFTLNEQTGLAYSGDMSLETGVFGSREEAATFTWKEGLFSFMENLARKIEAGKVPETSMELGDNSERMQELLLYRSTVGARVNRLELQQSRLESTQTTYTELLSKTEDANIAEVIMQLQLQENVYKASLAAGARIIMPSLMDFLR